MRVLQGLVGLTTETDRAQWLPVVDEFRMQNRLEDLDPTIPLLVYSNMATSWIMDWIDKQRPVIAMNRPHLGGWAKQYTYGARRFSINGYACTRWGQRTHDRFYLLNIPRHAWKVREVRRVLIAPPGKLLWFWQHVQPDQWAQEQAQFFADKGVKVRFRWKYDNRKGKKGRYADLWQDLDWADLVVSWGSAITAEAFYYGKKVISLGPCATWTCCDRDYGNWQDPSEPAGRAEWHEHMAWTQFTQQEMTTGAGAEMILQYQGWPVVGQ
jgi:hypothetical protein